MNIKMRVYLGIYSIFLFAPLTLCAAEQDILIADFEGEDYGEWIATGEAFGPGPAHGALPRQMRVSGFQGRGLVNTFFKGDGTTGTLTSPPLTIQRKYINFLIGGGMHPGETCINLLVGVEIVRSATGPNDRPGGTERLDWHTWDVSDLIGKTAKIQIVDKHRGGWGHINIDQIVQSDVRKGTVETVEDIRIERDYIVFRMDARQGPRSQARLIVGGKPVRTTVGSSRKKPYWISWDVSRLKGKPAQLRIAELPSPDGALALRESCAQSDQPKGVIMIVDKLYQETYRPQFHFTAKKNWHNDPNGLMYYKGEYHLFFQHNPHGINWGNMTWGHAISSDLVHWTQLDHAIYPDELGPIFSGSGVVDWNNTAGFQTGDEKTLVCIYTSAGNPVTQSIAYSNDRGRTWTKYEKNPVLEHIVAHNRDPKVTWREPTKKWVMALYLDKNDYALFVSPNLKEWTKTCDVNLPGSAECPDFFELPVDGDPKNTRWVFWGANGNYLIGTFDGETFTKESGPHRSEWGANCYAAQTWSDIPESDGRRIQIAWMNGGKYPGMPFNQQMSFPRVLTLRTTPKGVRLFIEPIKEIEKIHNREHSWRGKSLKPGENMLSGISGDLFDIRAEIEMGSAKRVGFDVRGNKIEYSASDETLSCLNRKMPLAPVDGRIKLWILVDRTSLEIFGNDGRRSMSSCFLPDLANTRLGIYAEGGEARVVSLKVYELRSIWPVSGVDGEDE